MIYLDNGATTPLRPEAREAMEPFLTGNFGNATGAHGVGRAAKYALEEAREQIAELLALRPREVIFTSGATEANNLALKGVARSVGQGTILTSAIEHSSVINPSAQLINDGFNVQRIPVGSDGLVDVSWLADALDENVILVSVMLVNNEVGTIQPIREISKLVTKNTSAVVHSDAVHAMSWCDVVHHLRHTQLASFSAHKFGGPKATGAFLIREGTSLTAEISGGGQEWEMRAGTVNVGNVVAMAAALAATFQERDQQIARVKQLRDNLQSELLRRAPMVRVNVADGERVASNLHITVPSVEADALLVSLDQRGVCVSIGSSCASGATEPSHVLTAMGFSNEDARSSIRITLGYATTQAEIVEAAEKITECVEQLSPEKVA